MLSSLRYKKSLSLVVVMSTREHHYARIREALTDALSKIDDIPTDDDDDDDDVEKKRIVCAIPTPFVEFQDQFPDELYPEVRIERAIGAGMMSNKTTGGGGGGGSGSEVVLVESSTNSFRLSVKLKHSDELDAILTKQLSRFMHQRAEQFSIVRKKAIHDEFDLSFLVTEKHKKRFVNSSLVAFMVDFLKSVDGEISEQKLSVSSRGRAVAEVFLSEF